MRLTELFLDRLNETSLFEMAYKRKKALEIVSDYSDTLAEHLIKVLAFDDEQGDHHHFSEINGYFARMNRIRWDRKKLLSKDDFFHLLWDGPLGHGASAVDDIVDGLVRLKKYNLPRSNLSSFQIYELLHKMYLDFTFDLSKGKVNEIEFYIKQHL